MPDFKLGYLVHASSPFPSLARRAVVDGASGCVSTRSNPIRMRPMPAKNSAKHFPSLTSVFIVGVR